MRKAFLVNVFLKLAATVFPVFNNISIAEKEYYYKFSTKILVCLILLIYFCRL